MPVGPFNEPYGKDCFRNDFALEVCCSIFIVIVSILASIYFYELVTRRKSFPRPVLYVYFTTFIQLLANIAFLFCMIFKPDACFTVWAVVSVWIWAQTAAMLHVGFQSVLKILRDLLHQSIIQVIGGMKVLIALGVAFWCGSLLNLIGAVGTAVSVWNNDIGLALVFWQLHCASFTFAYLVIMAYMFYCFTRLIEAFNQFLKDFPQSSTSQDKQAEMKEMHLRFRISRMVVMANAPLATGIWIFHCFILPVFWYIALLHVLNMMNAAVGSLYVWTSYSRKLKMYRFFCGCKGDDFRKDSKLGIGADNVKISQITSSAQQ